MKLVTCAAVVALTIMSCQKKSSDDAQPAPNKVEDAKGEAPSAPSNPSNPSNPSTPEVVPGTTTKQVVLDRFDAYVAANYAGESKADKQLLSAELAALEGANPNQDLSVFKAQLDELLAISKGRTMISQVIEERYSDLDALTKAELLAEFEVWSGQNLLPATGSTIYTVENFDDFMGDHSQDNIVTIYTVLRYLHILGK